jgi:putative addiction module component (TIGR02574 family)
MTLNEIMTATRALPPAEREELYTQIAESLDEPLSVEEAAWAETAERRAEELRSGRVPGVPADEVFAKARRKLGLGA